MTSYQRQLFSEILDLNYEMSVGDYPAIVMEAMAHKLDYLEEEMEDDMGVREWREFKDKGARMFAPA